MKVGMKQEWNLDENVKWIKTVIIFQKKRDFELGTQSTSKYRNGK